jgi:hypothetical protein
MYCLCVNVYCHRVSTQLQLTNISISVQQHCRTVACTRAEADRPSFGGPFSTETKTARVNNSSLKRENNFKF